MKKKQLTCRSEKISKGIKENKLTVMTKRLLWEFNSYSKLMCTDKNNDKNKTNLPSSFHSSDGFLNFWKTAKPMTLKFSDFQFVSINCFVIFNNDCMSGLFCIADLLDVGRKKKDFFNFMVFNLLQAKMK